MSGTTDGQPEFRDGVGPCRSAGFDLVWLNTRMFGEPSAKADQTRRLQEFTT
jgi:hypothetical protein